MSQSATYRVVASGALYLDVMKDVPNNWPNLVNIGDIDSPEDVISFLARHMFDGQYSDTSQILDLIDLVDENDREDRGFSNTIDMDPDYNITNEELVTEWRREITRRRNGGGK